MTASHWARLLPPATFPERTATWQARPRDVSGLAGLRRRLGTTMRDGGLPPGADDGERLLLVVEELVSNALRHGGAPVCVTVTASHLGWLVAVSDAAADRPPVPALDRDPGEGGMGLALVARICRAHGWGVEGDRKIVWARVPYREPLRADRTHQARHRAVTLIAGLTDTAMRTAELLDEVAAREDAAGRAEVAHRCRADAARARLEAERARYIASLTPRRISHTLTGQAVAKPSTMPICMPSQ